MSKLNQMLDEVKAELQDRVIQSIRDDILGKKNHGSKVPEPGFPQFSVTATLVCVHSVPSAKGLPMVLVTQRSRKCDTFPGKWCFPGGFLEPGETLQECAARELKEELGMNVPDLDDLVLADIFSAPGIDPRGQVINAVFVWRMGSNDMSNIICGAEVAEWMWCDAPYLAKTDMAFNHGEIAGKLYSGES